MNSDRPPNPGIAHLVLVNTLRRTIREKEEIIAKLEAQIARRGDGLHMLGWWCACGIFNGEEKEKRDECRSCGILKPEMTYP